MYHHLNVYFSVSSCLLDVCHFYKSLLWHTRNSSGNTYIQRNGTLASKRSKICQLNYCLRRVFSSQLWSLSRNQSTLPMSVNRESILTLQECEIHLLYNCNYAWFVQQDGSSEVSTVFKLSYYSGPASPLPALLFYNFVTLFYYPPLILSQHKFKVHVYHQKRLRLQQKYVE